MEHTSSHHTLFEGYTFIQGLDSVGGDIYNLGTSDLHLLKKVCDTDDNILAFNTNGWVKTTLKPQSEWDHFSNDPRHGTYVKRVPTAIEGYVFVQGLDSAGGDLRNIDTTDIHKLKEFCDANDCLGFNTNGWVKTTLKPQSQWDRFSNDPSEGTYVKQRH